MVDRDECNRPEHDARGAAEAEGRVQGDRQAWSRATSLAVLRWAPPRLSKSWSASARRRSAFSRSASPRLLRRRAASPTRWGSGRCSRWPKLLKYAGLKMDDIDVVELNEAFAPRCRLLRDRLGIDMVRLNPKRRLDLDRRSVRAWVRLAHGRRAGPRLKRRKKRWGTVTMCVGGGMGAGWSVRSGLSRRSRAKSPLPDGRGARVRGIEWELNPESSSSRAEALDQSELAERVRTGRALLVPAVGWAVSADLLEKLDSAKYVYISSTRKDGKLGKPAESGSCPTTAPTRRHAADQLARQAHQGRAPEAKSGSASPRGRTCAARPRRP